MEQILNWMCCYSNTTASCNSFSALNFVLLSSDFCLDIFLDNFKVVNFGYSEHVWPRASNFLLQIPKMLPEWNIFLKFHPMCIIPRKYHHHNFCTISHARNLFALYFAHYFEFNFQINSKHNKYIFSSGRLHILNLMNQISCKQGFGCFGILTCWFLLIFWITFLVKGQQ